MEKAFKVLNPLSSQGANASTYLATEIETNRAVVIKILKNCSRTDLLFSRESEIHSSLNHPTIVPFVASGFTVSTNEPFIATLYMKNGDLNSVITKQNNFWNSTSKYKAIYGIASGLNYIHSKKILHRDIKPGNILLNDNFEIQIADFGYSREVHNKMTTQIGSPYWMAPEILDSVPDYDYSVDVFSWAILAFQIIAGFKDPYNGLFDQYSYPSFQGKIVLQGVRPDIRLIPKPISTLIQKAWDQRPFKRPDFHTICAELEKPEYYFPDCDTNELQRYFEFCRNSSEGQTSKAEKQYQKALRLLNKTHNQAIPILQTLVEQNYAPAIFTYGKILEEGTYAARDYSQACNVYSKIPDGSIYIARMFYDRKIMLNGIEDIEGYCKSIFDANMDNSYALVGNAIISLHKGLDDEAYQYLMRAYAIEPHNYEVDVLMGDLIMTHRLDRPEDDASVYYQEALSHGYEKAAVNYSRYIRKDSHYSAESYKQSLALLEKHDRCIECKFEKYRLILFNGTLQKDERKELEYLSSNYPEACIILATYYKLMESNQVITWLQKAGDFGEAYQMLGNEYRRSDCKKAIEFYKKAISLNNGDAYYYLGRFYQQGVGFQKDQKMAFEYFKKAAFLGSANGYGALAQNEFFKPNRDLIKTEYYFLNSISESAPYSFYNVSSFYKMMASFDPSHVQEYIPKAKAYLDYFNTAKEKFNLAYVMNHNRHITLVHTNK